MLFNNILLESAVNIRVESARNGKNGYLQKKIKKLKKTFKKVLTSRFECGIISYVASEEVKSDTTNSHMGV